jgi:2-isopropylmalate synthase
VQALDQAIRGGLERLFPWLGSAGVTRFSVRAVPSGQGGAPVTRVLVEAGDGESSWVTVGVDGNPVVASWEAVYQSITYALLTGEVRGPAAAVR